MLEETLTGTAREAGPTVTVCLSHFATGGPGKGHGANKPSPAGRVQEKSKGSTRGPAASQDPPWNPRLSDACATRKDPETE